MIGTRSNRIRLGLILSLVLIFLNACSLASNQDLVMNLDESKVNQIIQGAPLAQNVPFRITGVDMKDGYMRVFMSYRKENGSELIGSYDISLKVDAGAIGTDILNVDMPGLVLNQQILDQIAELISRDFSYGASMINGQVVFKTLKMSEDNLVLTVQINR